MKQQATKEVSTAVSTVQTVQTPTITAYERQSQSVEDIIMQAVKSGLPVDAMERVLAMRRELKAEYSEEQFNRAMTEFQRNCPVIEKKKKGVKANYAPFEDIVEETKQLMADNGFSYRITATMGDDSVTATCVVTHIDGHKESSEFTAKVDSVKNREGSSVRTAMQDTAVALSFSKRYAFVNAFGIATKNEDTDGAARRENANRTAEIVDGLKSCREVAHVETIWRSLTVVEKANSEIVRAIAIRKAELLRAAGAEPVDMVTPAV